MHYRFSTYVNTLQSGTNESEIIMKSVQSSYVMAQASHPPHRIIRNTDSGPLRHSSVCETLWHATLCLLCSCHEARPYIAN